MRTGRPPPSKIFPWRAKRLLQKMLSRGEPNVGEEKRCEGRKTMLRSDGRSGGRQRKQINILEQILSHFSTFQRPLQINSLEFACHTSHSHIQCYFVQPIVSN